MKQRKHQKFRRLPAFLLAAVLCLTLAAPALAEEDATAASIQLAKTEGAVSATNSAGRNVSLIKNLRLFSGYHVLTEEKSYAWLNLDSAKLLKEDASSDTEVRKSGKKLEVLLRSGNLFFNVTEPLDDDETLNIRTSTTLTGVRGTCGWVKVVNRWTTQVCILEGEVECVVTDPVSGENEPATISAGETAVFTVRPGDSSALKEVEITRTRCNAEDIPGYVLVELAEDESLCGDILDASGLDILGGLSRNGDPAGEARRRLEEEEAAAASRLASIAAREQAQANNVESAPNSPVTPNRPLTRKKPFTSNGSVASDRPDTANPDSSSEGDWSWRYDTNTKTLYIEGSGAMRGYPSNDLPWKDYLEEVESVVVGENITKIGGQAFCGCSNLTRVTIPDSVTSIASLVFASCKSLTSITIPDTVTSIGNGAFSGCYNLTSVTIPEGVTSIENYTFLACHRLTSVRIPASVTSIGDRAFDDCTSLTDVYYGGSQSQWEAITIGADNDILTGASVVIHYNSP